MQVTPIKTPVIHPSDDLLSLIHQQLEKIAQQQSLEKTVLAVTSKVVALAEGAVVDIPDDPNEATKLKEELIRHQAEYYLDASFSKYNLMLTIKHSVLAVNAGIDASNVDNQYVLLPQDPYSSAAEIWHSCRDKFQLNEFGVIITDSKSYPLRWGRIGTTISHCGFQALTDRVGTPDLYGKPLVMTKVDVAEGLAMAAVLEMGEADESQPLCLLDGISQIQFQDHPPTTQEIDELKINLSDDVYGPLLTAVEWKQGEK